MSDNIKVIGDRSDIVAIADAVRSKTGKTDNLTLFEIPDEILSISGSGDGDVTVVPLNITENGVYDTDYTTATETWDNNTEYEGSVTVDGVTLSFKRAENLIVPDDFEELNNNAYTFRLESDILEDPNDGYICNSLSITPDVFAVFEEYSVLWVKNATLLNAQLGISFLEDNTVYITNYPQLIYGAHFGAEYVKISVTAPSEKIENLAYRPVTVDVKPELEDLYVYENGTYSPNSSSEGFGNVFVDVPTFTPSGEYHIGTNGVHDIRDYETVNVNVPNAAVCGVWKFNETIDVDIRPNFDYFSVNFMCNGVAMRSINTYSNGVKGLFYSRTNGGDVRAWTPSEGWLSEEYKTIDFGQDPQIISDYLKNWLVRNATQSDVYSILQEKTVTQNGVVVPDDGYDALSKVTVAIGEYDGSIIIE